MEEESKATLVMPAGDGPVQTEGPELRNLTGPERYEAGGLIGRGGMGVVRSVKDVLLNRTLAMKSATTTDPAALDRFVTEARVQGQLQHPGIVPVHDLGVAADGVPYFTMKRVRGVALDEVIRGLAKGNKSMATRFPRRRLLTAFQSVCLAIDFAHSRRVLHRDLKPANIMLGEYGEVYVLDWGLAGRIDGAAEAVADQGPTPEPKPGKTAAGALMGTPGYMAPEQILGEKPDERADVWALGAIFFELLTLQPLVEGVEVEELLDATVNRLDARAAVRAPGLDIPPELEAIAVTATEHERANRYASARALHDALEAFLSGERDEKLRSELAARHAQTAAGLASDLAEGRGGAGDRAEALREVGRSLALDPQNATAMRALVSLFEPTRGTIPAEVRAELDAATAAQTKAAGKVAAITYLSILGYVPLLFWMGVRDWALLGAMCGSIVVTAAVAWAVSLRRAPQLRAVLPVYAASAVMIATTGFVLGPFVALPSFAAVNAVAFAVLLGKRYRLIAVTLGTLPVLIPVFAGSLGLIPAALRFSESGLELRPQMVNFPAGPTMVLLVVSAVGTIVLAALAISQLSEALREAQQRLLLQSWHLRQLLPREASAATTGELPAATAK